MPYFDAVCVNVFTKEEMREFMSSQIKPGLFGQVVAADARRSVYDAQNEELLMQGVPIDAVFIGDSITEMWVLDAYFRATQGLLVNRGIGGDITSYIRLRFAADVLQLRPRLTVIFAGINNFWDMDNWLNPDLIRTSQAIEDEIVINLTEMVMAARDQQIEVALCSILPTNIPVNSNTGKRNEAIKRVNERLQRMAGEQGATFVDYHRHFIAEDGLTLRDGFADDGLHPRAVGYKLMAATLLASLPPAQRNIIASRA